MHTYVRVFVEPIWMIRRFRLFTIQPKVGEHGDSVYQKIWLYVGYIILAFS